MTDDDTPGYLVGYRRPPRNTRFKPGQSGNPKGRPKGSKNLNTAIEAELGTRVVVTENGKRRKVTKRQVIAKQVVNKAAAGDLRATALVVEHERTQEATRYADTANSPFATPEDAAVMAGIIARIRSSVPLTDAPSTPSRDHREEGHENG